MSYVVRKSACQIANTCCQIADICRVDEIGQVKFKLMLNVTVDWSFLPWRISDADCSSLKFWFKHRCRMTIAVYRRPVFRRTSIMSSMGTGSTLDKMLELISNCYLRPKLFLNFPKNIHDYKQTKIVLMYIFSHFVPLTFSFSNCD